MYSPQYRGHRNAYRQYNALAAILLKRQNQYTPKPLTNKYFSEDNRSQWLFSINNANAKYIPVCTNLSAFQTPTTGTFRAGINDKTNIVTTHKQQRSRQCNSFISKFLFIKIMRQSKLDKPQHPSKHPIRPGCSILLSPSNPHHKHRYSPPQEQLLSHC
jgi:hypothetical protein